MVARVRRGSPRSAAPIAGSAGPSMIWSARTIVRPSEIRTGECRIEGERFRVPPYRHVVVVRRDMLTCLAQELERGGRTAVRRPRPAEKTEDE